MNHETARHEGAHVYVVWWPHHSVIKVGCSEARRWQKWRLRDGKEIALIPADDHSHARKIEGVLLRSLKDSAEPAFATRNEAQSAGLLSDGGLGWSECYRIPRSPMFGAAPLHDLDYEAAYGLVLPAALEIAISKYTSATFTPVSPLRLVGEAS